MKIHAKPYGKSKRYKKKIKCEKNSSRVKCRSQLVVRLKANKYYEELLYYLSSHIHLLNHQAFLINCRLLAGSRLPAFNSEFLQISDRI